MVEAEEEDGRAGWEPRDGDARADGCRGGRRGVEGGGSPASRPTVSMSSTRERAR